jgi:hypothetical protein
MSSLINGTFLRMQQAPCSGSNNSGDFEGPRVTYGPCMVWLGNFFTRLKMNQKPVPPPIARSQTAPTESQRTCRFCYSTVPAASQFCHRCGKSINRPTRTVLKFVRTLGFLTLFVCIGLAWHLVLNLPRPQWTHSSEGSSINSSTSTGNTINGEWFGCTSKDDMQRLIGYANAKDYAAFERAMEQGIAAGRIRVFNAGDQIVLVKGELLTGLKKVRLRGDTEEYWIPIEATY